MSSWTHDSMSTTAIRLWLRIDWESAACLAHWMPTAAWMNEGWGATPATHETLVDVINATLNARLPVVGDELEMRARLHWAELGGDQSKLGRRSPCHRLAKRVCESCPILVDCFEYALEAYEPGTWGGSSERQRRDERSRRRRTHHRRG